MTGLGLENLSLSVASRPLIAGLSFHVAPRETLTVMGPSGAGKSALLAFLGGHLAPPFAASGRVLLDGRDVTASPPEKRSIGLLFQDDLLFPHLTVGANIAFALPRSVRDRRAAIAAALAEADLQGFAGRDPSTLSGGQRARVALMRALAAAPKALLLDEPFGKLDVPLRRDFRRFVFDHARRRALPVVLVTHDPADAEAAAGPVLTLGDSA